MTTPRRALGTGPSLPAAPPRDPRARTAAERIADGDWVEQLPETADRPRPTARRVLGTGGGRDEPDACSLQTAPATGTEWAVSPGANGLHHDDA